MKKIKQNPELLIINPDEEEPQEVFDTLMDEYEDPDDAMTAFCEMYPDAVKCDKEDFEDNKEFQKARKLFRKFHGVEPDEIIAIDDESLPETDEDKFLVMIGQAPSEAYLANAIQGSKKQGAVYVHPYESDEDDLPPKVVTADGRLIMTLPGKHKVSDWIRG